LKVYLSVPMIANRTLERARVLERAIKDSGHEVSSPWVLGPIETSSGGVNIFDRDRRGAENSDAILADVSEPSTGVGMEIMAAYKAKKRVIVVAKRGNRVSQMLMHMDGKELVEFEDNDELYKKLLELLGSPSDAVARST
jgi:nucleoside 2-deoxyribosyltransferase